MFLSELITALGGTLQGEDVQVSRIAALENAQSDALTFLSNSRFKSQALASQAAALLIRPADAEGISKPAILTDDPYLYYARAAALLHPAPAVQPGIHPRATVDETAQVHPSAQIGPNVVVEAGAVIGANVVLRANVFVGANAQIGAGSILYPNVTLMNECILGERCILHPGAVIGADGFGNAWAKDHWEKIPQIGRVVLGNDVEIGANATVDRGAIDDTVLSNGVRIDNLVMLGHNVHVGEHTAMAAMSGISGSVRIGARCQFGGATRMGGHIEIGDDVILLNSALVSKSIRSKGIYAGSPVQTHDQWLKNAAHLRHLDALSGKVKQLEKKLAAQDTAAAQEEE